MTDDDLPISYQAAVRGTPVLSSSGATIGTLEQVLEVPEVDVFDGIVIDTGGIADFRVGQAVACAGAGKANHSEIVSVPGNLVAAVPDGVRLRDAAFTTLGAIAMQGVRRAEPSESVA